MNSLHPFQPLLGLGDFSEIYVEESSGLTIRWEEEKVEAITTLEEAGVGLRILNGYETRYGHMDLARPFDQTALDPRLIQIKNELSPGLSTSETKPLNTPSIFFHKILKPPSNFSLEQKIDLLTRAFNAAKGGPPVRQININFSEKKKKVGYLNSTGESFIEERIYLVFNMTLTVERNGLLQNAYESLGGLLGFELFDGKVIEELAAKITDRAHRKLDAPEAPVGEMPVVIASSAGGTLIHEAIGHSLEADAVLEGTSPSYVGKIGKLVANEKLNVFDDPTVPSARGSFQFDDEGIRAERTPLIENGILKDYLFDRLSAKKAGRSSNGHGRRESYAHRPLPRMSNTFVAPGKDDPRRILNEFESGLLVTKMGGGQVNTANGDFVFDVEEGYRVEKGKRTLVRGATLLGNGPEVLMMIDKLGSDHGWAIGTCGKEGQGVPVSDALPTVHIKKMVVGGIESHQ